ncbi:MAG: Ig-like domain repeat protein, partial [Candidatus Bathyarchaeia archaeon]
MKNVNKALVLFLITLITISSISAIGGFAGVAKACGKSYDIEISTINGLSPWNGPFFNPITLTGSASGQNFEGQLSQYQVEVVWGDGTKDVTSTVHFTQDDNDFSGTWTSNSHTYAQPGTYSITVRLYHSQPPGSDGSSDAVDSANCVISSMTSLTLSKTSPQIAGASLTATATISPSEATGSVQFQVEIPGSSTWNTFDTRTLSSGSATSKSYTLSNVGVYKFQAVYSGDCHYSGSTSSTVSLTVNLAPAVNFVVSGFPSPTIAGAAHSVTVTAKDANGNVATGYIGTVHFTSSDSQAVLPVDYTFVSGDAGSKSFSVTLETVGSQSITATDTVTSTITGSQSGITVNAAGAAKLAFVGVPSSLTAGVTSGGITVQLQDQYGNPVNARSGGVTVTLSPSGVWYSNSGGTTLISNNQRTISSGSSSTSSFYFKSTAAGLFSLVASATGYTSASASLTVNAASATSFVVSGFPSPTIAGAAHSVTVTAKDQYGNVATAFSGTVTITSSDLAATLPPPGSLTNGVGSFSVTLKTSGTQSISATSGSVSGSQVGIQVNAAGATYFVVAAPDSAIAGKAFSITVTAKDQYGNTVTNYAGTVHFTSCDAQAILPADSGLTNGVGSFSVTLETDGYRVITATDTMTSSITGYATVLVNSATAYKLVFTDGAGQSLYAGQVSNVITVQLQDQYGNPVTSGATVSLSSTSAGGKFFSDSAGSNQITSVSIACGSSTASFYYSDTVAGSPTLTASSAGVTSATTTVTISSSSVTHFSVLASPTTVTAGSSVTVLVTAEDLYGNVVTGYAGMVHFSSSDVQAVLPANAGLTNGVGSFSVTLKTAGSQTLTATDTVTASITGSASVLV